MGKLWSPTSDIEKIMLVHKKFLRSVSLWEIQTLSESDYIHCIQKLFTSLFLHFVVLQLYIAVTACMYMCLCLYIYIYAKFSIYSLKSSWLWCHKLGTFVWQFRPFIFAEPLELHWFGWELSVHRALFRYFQSE